MKWKRSIVLVLGSLALLVAGCGSGGPKLTSVSAAHPVDGMRKIPVRPITVKWAASDPSVQAYRVEFGESPDAMQTVSKDIRTTELSVPGRLKRNQKYCWRVIASDQKSGESAGPVWSFQTERLVESLAYQIAVGDRVLQTQPAERK